MAEWQRAMSSREFAEWMAFYRIQPFGEWRRDLRMAMLAAQITNVMTRTKDSDPVTDPKVFMPDFEAALDEMEVQEVIPEHERVWRKVEAAFGALTPSQPPPNSGKR